MEFATTRALPVGPFPTAVALSDLRLLSVTLQVGYNEAVFILLTICLFDFTLLVSTPICNATSAPPSCAYCDPTAPIGSQGCENGGQCYYQPLDGVPPPGLPICGCLVGFDAPQCATVTSPPLPICNASNPAEQYPSCLYCDPRLPAGEDGCFNGGSCYYETNFPVPRLRECQFADVPTDLPLHRALTRLLRYASVMPRILTIPRRIFPTASIATQLYPTSLMETTGVWTLAFVVCRR